MNLRRIRVFQTQLARGTYIGSDDLETRIGFENRNESHKKKARPRPGLSNIEISRYPSGPSDGS